MDTETTHSRYLEALLSGDRKAARQVIAEAMQTGVPAVSIYADIIWPIMVEIDKLARTDRIKPAEEHMATRINRTIVDQLQNKLPRRPFRDKKIVVACAPMERHELGAQMMADMFESDGWEVRFLGGGLTNDEILTFIHYWAPNMLLVYGTEPSQAPDIRHLIDKIRSINAWPDMRIMLSGGLFNRAEGLCEEIGGDVFAADAIDAIQKAAIDEPVRPFEKSTINKRKRKKQQQKIAEGISSIKE